MTDKDLGTAAGEIFAKAFTLGYETGREYVPVGGMALTAEQVEDVRALVWLDGRRNFDAFYRLRALFPATEPAEDIESLIERSSLGTESTQDAIDSVSPEHGRRVARMAAQRGKVDEPRITSEGGKRWHLTETEYVEFDAAGDIWINMGPHIKDARKAAAALLAAAEAEDDAMEAAMQGEYPPAPAEPAEEEGEPVFTKYPGKIYLDPETGEITGVPAEEETKAEASDWCIGSMCRHAHIDGANRKHIRGSDCPPAPTQEQIATRGRLLGIARKILGDPSPGVPAPTETGPWPTWQEVLEGVWYQSGRDRVARAVWMNIAGIRYIQVPSDGVAKPCVITSDYMVNYAPFVAAEEG